MHQNDIRSIRERIRAGANDLVHTIGPAAQPSGAADVANMSSSRSGQRLLTLLVTHHDRDAAQVLIGLRRGGFDVRHERVADADSFDAALAAHPWDLVVAEFHIPDWFGMHVLQRVLSRGYDIPVVLMCGAIGEDAAATAMRQGATDCISKGLLQTRLALSVHTELDRRENSACIRPRATGLANIGAGIQALGNLTELKSQERRQLRSDAASRTMFDSSPVAMLLLLPFSRITNANDKMVELSGYTRAELLGRTINELALRVDDALGQDVVTRLRSSQAIAGLEMNLRRKDGSHRRVLLSSELIEVDGVQQRLHSLVDVTAQRAAMDESRLVQQALASISQGVLISGPDRLTLSINAAFESMTGYTEPEMLGQPCSILQGVGTNPQVISDMRAALDVGQAFCGEILNYHKDGTTFWNELSINPVRDDDGGLTHFVGILRNVSERRRLDQQIRLAAQVFAQSREGVTVTDANNKIVMVNHAFTEISGYDESEVLGMDPRAMDSNVIDEDRYRAKWQTIRDTGRWQGETMARRKDGTTYPESLTITVIRDENGEICNYVRTFSDLSAQRAADARIDRLSHFDPLTDLPNRNLLADRCEHDIKAARRDATPVAMLMLGIDQFKSINSTLGQNAGDQLLRQFAAWLLRTVREMDTVARVGGDEFVLVLPGETAAGAHLLANRLQQGLLQPFDVDNAAASVSASIGIAVLPPDGVDFPSLFNSAQVAMHQAKERGRGKVRFYSADMFQQSVELATLGTELRRAVSRGQLYLHYQPFADLQTGRIGGMEALLRWTHPEHGTVSPARFIPIAERLGLIVDIGAWVLRQACEDARRWRLSGLEVPTVSVNLSPVQFRDPGLAQQVAATLAEFDMDPQSLCLELTEGAVMDDVVHSETLMRELKALGVRLSLDDFGTGYSSLSYLKLFPFDKVKIDQSFVRGVHTNPQDAVLAKVVISMAHGLGLRAIAEGVETESQCAFMCSHMCDEIQGYYFSRPVPADAMAALLQEDRRLPVHLVRMLTHTRTSSTSTLTIKHTEPNGTN